MPRNTGSYETTTTAGERVAAFVPAPLPPGDPPVALEGPLQDLLREAEHGLAQLDLAGAMIPSVDWFLYAFVRKEAVVSSQIEGTQATLEDLLSFEDAGASEPAEAADLEEVCNYLDALAYARAELRRERGLPLSVRLLNGAHRELLKGVRGADKRPGELRRSQNWIGGTRPGNAVFVPPPPQRLGELLADLEQYVHAPGGLPPLVRTALLHVQFETIHPYLDGNGRIGRLLIALLLEHWGLLAEPLLYLSLFFKRHRAEYYRLLGAVRTEGDWEAWIAFFLEGVATIAGEAVDTARELFALVERDRGRVLTTKGATVVAARLFEELPRHPVLSVASVTRMLGTTKPTAAKAVQALSLIHI